MFSQSVDYSQSSTGDYNFLHNTSQNSSQFELDGMLNKNQNILGELGTINEENPLSPMKMNYNNDSKKSNINNINISKSSKYSFGNNKMNVNIGGESSNISNIGNNDLKHTQKNMNMNNNKENINANINVINNKISNKNNENTNNDIMQNNINSFKCQLSQQIDQMEKIASQSINNVENYKNSNKINDNNNKKNVNNMNMNINMNSSNAFFNNNISEDEIREHQRFNKYCSDLIDNAMNKNLEYIDNIKNNFVNSLDTYKTKFKTNAEIIKQLILLYSDDIFQKEKNKNIISSLTDQLLTQINAFFQEMNKYNNINLNSKIINNNDNEDTC
jgi:hypothetical protein